MCFTPLLSFKRRQTIPSWRHGPVPLAVVRHLLVCWRDPGMNLQMPLQMCPLVEMSQTKNTESVLKWICVLSFSESPSANEVVNPWSEQRGYFISCSKSYIEWSVCLETPKSLNSLEDSEMQSATPSEVVKIPIAVAPLEANERVEFLEFKMWWHLIPVRIVRIPIVIRRIRKKEMDPLGGVFGCAFQIVLIPDKKLEVNCGLQDLVLVLTSAVTPSLDEGAPLVLLILVGWIWL